VPIDSRANHRILRLIFVVMGIGLISCPLAWGQANTDGQIPPENAAVKKQATPGTELPPEPPAAKIDVAPLASDQQIQQRLIDILKATSWFIDPEVEVQEGVAFLRGQASTDQHRKWAGDLARSTEDVVAVVNQIELIEPSIWDMSPAWSGLLDLWRGFVRGVPWIVFSILILLFAWIISRLARRMVLAVIYRRLENVLLRNVVSFLVGSLVILGGVYLILRVAGLMQLALTVLGGTGIIGIALGIGFRDITENFLASILLSIQNPFRTGDLIDIGGTVGYVQRMTIRSTVLMTLQGNQVQVPNATVYKATILNFTSTPNRREEFSIGIGYDVPIPFAQDVALKVLAEHPAVLREPEPWVLVDSLGSATVNLKVYFWLNGHEHSWLKVRSAVIRLVKRAFQDHGVTMPDESRELLFPHEVPVRLVDTTRAQPATESLRPLPPAVPETTVTTAEGGLSSDASELERQAAQSRLPDAGDNLLKPS